MKRSLLLFVTALSFGCRTPKASDSSSAAKDIESVTRVQLITPTNSAGQRIAVIKCAEGFRDQATGLTIFSVTYDTIRNRTQDQLETQYCTDRVGNGNPPPWQGGGGGGPLVEGELNPGRYQKTDGDPQACASFDLAVLRTPTGGIARATIQCASGGSLLFALCNVNSCSDPGNNRLSWIRGNVIILSLVNNGVARDSTYVLSGGGHQTACPNGYVPVPGDAAFGTTAFCVMKYEAKANTASTPEGTPLVSIDWNTAKQRCQLL